MLTAADVWYQAAPQYLLLPAGALFVTVLALTVLGDGIRTALDPRAASRLRVGTGRKREAKADAKSGASTVDSSVKVIKTADVSGNAVKSAGESVNVIKSADANGKKEDPA
jgi:peptide/nickel transport system permease protein